MKEYNLFRFEVNHSIIILHSSVTYGAIPKPTKSNSQGEKHASLYIHNVEVTKCTVLKPAYKSSGSFKS